MQGRGIRDGGSQSLIQGRKDQLRGKPVLDTGKGIRDGGSRSLIQGRGSEMGEASP